MTYGLTICNVNQVNRVCCNPDIRPNALEHIDNRATRVVGFFTASKDDRIATFKADRRGIRCHIWP